MYICEYLLDVFSLLVLLAVVLLLAQREELLLLLLLQLRQPLAALLLQLTQLLVQGGQRVIGPAAHTQGEHPQIRIQASQWSYDAADDMACFM